MILKTTKVCIGSSAYLSAAHAAPPMNDATTNAITVVNLARCMVSSICGYYKRPRPAASLAGREVGQSDGGGCGDRRDHGQEDWAKDAPTDTAAEQKRFGDETSERDSDQKRAPAVLTLAVKRTRSRTVATRPPAALRSDVAPIVMGAPATTLAP